MKILKDFQYGHEKDKINYTEEGSIYSSISFLLTSQPTLKLCFEYENRKNEKIKECESEDIERFSIGPWRPWLIMRKGFI